MSKPITLRYKNHSKPHSKDQIVLRRSPEPFSGTVDGQMDGTREIAFLSDTVDERAASVAHTTNSDVECGAKIT